MFYHAKYLAGQLHLSMEFFEDNCFFAMQKSSGKYHYEKILTWLNTKEGREIRNKYYFGNKVGKVHLTKYQQIWQNCTVKYIEWVRSGGHLRGIPMEINGCEVKDKGNQSIHITTSTGENIVKKKWSKKLEIYYEGEKLEFSGEKS